MKTRRLTFTWAIVMVVALVIPAGLAARDRRDHNTHHHYQLIDMGTFGGPNSNPAQDFSLNQRGVMVGWSATPTPTSPTSNPIVCGGVDGAVPFITVTFQWQDGTLTDLGALPGGSNCSEPFRVNDRGEIVGTSENGLVDPITGVNQTRAVRWENGEIQEIGSFGGTQNAAQGINTHGQISGWSLNTIPDPYTFNPFGTTQTRAFLWQNGQMRDLGTLGGPDAAGFGINEHGQISGYSNTNSIPNPVTGVPPIDPFLWQQGKGMQDLGTLGGAYGYANRLNNRGQVIGSSSTAVNPGACFTEGDPNCHVFLWDRGTLTDLTTSTVGGNPLTPWWINDAGEIVGGADFSASGGSSFDAYVWRNGVAIDLGHLQGDCFSGAQSINSYGEVVGDSFSCNFSNDRAFLWKNGSMVDLNTLIPPNPPLQLVASTDINDAGEIAGIGAPAGCAANDVGTCGHAFFLIPCDENHLGIEGCDYSLVDAIPVTQVGPVSRVFFSGTQRPFPPSRTNRFRFPGIGN
jgi:probable HAF family extracellular repeat protein